jgi:hypothetical protein
VIEIKRPDLRLIQVDIFGKTPLICNKWSEKAKREMLDKQMGKPKVKAFKNPEEDYKNSLYELPSGGYGFPAVAFKNAAVRAASNLDLTMVQARQMFFVRADEDDCVKIDGEPTMREDMVRLQGKTADIRYRGEFRDWKTTLTIEYNAGVISDEQVVNLFQLAGFSVGVGEWRPEKNGAFGCFTLFEEEATKVA